MIGGTMMAVAAGGLVVNGIAMWLLHGGKDESLNVRGAWLHVLCDTLGSIGVIVGGVLVWTLGWRWADPVAGALIGVLILYSSWELLQESVRVLMAASPEDVDVDRVRATFCEIDGV
ncbi:MAG: cation diffusion facilitator family transporter, partial [Gemmatimonadota bacterium]